MLPAESPAHPADPPLTVHEAAQYINTSDSYVRRLILERRIPYIKVAGYHVRIRRSALDALMQTVDARTSGVA